MYDIIRPPKLEPRKMEEMFYDGRSLAPSPCKIFQCCHALESWIQHYFNRGVGVNCHDLISAASLDASCTRLIGFTVFVNG